MGMSLSSRVQPGTPPYNVEMNMDVESTLLRLGLALALGLLVGLQRERAASRVAGVRTFALITLFGAVAGSTASALGPWLVPAGALALAAMLVIANIAKLRDDPDPGMTTEVAVLLMYAIGAYLVVGHVEVAVAVSGAVVLLLHFKQPMHQAVRAMGGSDMTAIMQFALVTLVVLPILPDQAYGPYDVLNPRQIWWMVVLIVSINLAGYVAAKLLGARSGALIGGVLGGMVSSTATTVSYARRTRATSPGTKEEAPAQAGLAALVIVAASTVSFARVLVEIAVVAPSQLAAMAVPLGAMMACMLVLSLAAWLLGRGDTARSLHERANPAELKPALVFGALYALVILAVAFAKSRFGAAGLYPVAVISGMTDMDAITLSTSNLAAQGRLEAQTAGRLILLAALANLVFKGGCACVLGSPALRTRIVILFGLALAGGAGILLLWS
jgi:uncharacterized membrane protein (DUF4010 family)